MPRIFFPNTNKIFAWHDYDNHGWFLIRNRYCLLFVIYTRFLGRVHVVFFIFLVFCVLVFFCFDCLPFVSCAQYCLCPWIMPNIACVPGLLCSILPVSLDYYAQYCLCPRIMPSIACVPGLCPILPVSLDYAQYCLCPWIIHYCLCPWIMPNIACVPGLCPILPVSLDYAQYCLCPWIIHYWLPLLVSLTYFLCLSFLIPFLKCTQSYNASSNTHLSYWLQCLWYDVLIRSPIDKCALDGHAIFVLYTSRLICMSYNITIFYIFSEFCTWSCKLSCRYEFTSIRCIFVEMQSLIRCYNCLI
jgi:hypothetical protein